MGKVYGKGLWERSVGKVVGKVYRKGLQSGGGVVLYS